MKVFCTSFLLLLFAVIEVAIILGCQYFAINGPDWITASMLPDHSYYSSGVIVFICIVLTVVNLANLVLFCVNIWDDK